MCIRDSSKIDQTPAEKESQAVDTAKKNSDITLGRMKNIFDYERPKRTANEIAREEQSRNPTRQYQNRTLALQEIRDEHPELASKIYLDPTTGMLTSTDSVIIA